jgi:hypothetical protein
VADPGLLAAIDFEASCLPSYGRSFPLEVGLSRVGTGETSSWLIKPIDAWLDWDWDPAAERIHGITLADALERGRPPLDVLRELADMARSMGVVADSSLDAVWLGVLADAAQRGAPFRVQAVGPVLQDLAEDPAAIEVATAVAASRYPHLHRAGPDARHLAEVIRVLAGYDGLTL